MASLPLQQLHASVDASMAFTLKYTSLQARGVYCGTNCSAQDSAACRVKKKQR
jgi:hypothetical protein